MRCMLILASASPRRRQLLGWLGVTFVVDSATVDEQPQAGETASALTRRLAHDKAAAVTSRRADDWALGADTVVEIDGALLGKPTDTDQAHGMLRRLAGREHRVVTGFALLEPGGVVRHSQVVTTRVHFRSLDDTAIRDYLSGGEFADKAGAYAIQGAGAGLIDRIEGSFTNVIGLPLVEVRAALEGVGLLGGP
jgi:septum formation protein